MPPASAFECLGVSASRVRAHAFAATYESPAAPPASRDHDLELGAAGAGALWASVARGRAGGSGPEMKVLVNGIGGIFDGGSGDSSRGGGGGDSGGDSPGDEPPRRSPLRWYLDLLERRPWTTKVITSCLITAASDILAQTIEGSTEIRWRRVGAFAVVGAALTAPLFHVLYGFLERTIPAKAGLRNVALQLMADQLLAAPIWLAGFFPIVHLVENGVHAGSAGELKAAFERDFVKSLCLTWCMFVPSQTLSFLLLPASTRVLMLNVVDLAYTSALSWLSHAPD